MGKQGKESCAKDFLVLVSDAFDPGRQSKSNQKMVNKTNILVNSFADWIKNDFCFNLFELLSQGKVLFHLTNLFLIIFQVYFAFSLAVSIFIFAYHGHVMPQVNIHICDITRSPTYVVSIDRVTGENNRPII